MGPMAADRVIAPGSELTTGMRLWGLAMCQTVKTP